MFSSHAELLERYFNEITVFLTSVLTLISYFLGGWDTALQTLLLFVGVDIVTGVLAGYKVDKSFSSKRLREGFMTKVMYLVVIALGEGLDNVFFQDAPILRTMACWFYVLTEASSIIENLGRLGVPLPDRFTDKLEQLKDKISDTNNDDNDKPVG